MDRRGFITGLIALGVAAPAIVRSSSLMIIKPTKIIKPKTVFEMPGKFYYEITMYDIGADFEFKSRQEWKQDDTIRFEYNEGSVISWQPN